MTFLELYQDYEKLNKEMSTKKLEIVEELKKVLEGLTPGGIYYLHEKDGKIFLTSTIKTDKVIGGAKYDLVSAIEYVFPLLVNFIESDIEISLARFVKVIKRLEELAKEEEK